MKKQKKDGRIVMLHKPHPTDIMDKGAVEDLVQKLKEMGEL